MKTGKCKLCQADNKLLCDTHIIPRFIYKYTNDKLHRSIPISPNGIYKMVQSGIKEPLLCKRCEEMFQKYEDELKKFLDEFHGNRVNIQDIGQGICEANNFDFQKVKKSILSILWRLSHTKSKEFKKYDLGSYQDKLRQTLVNDIQLLWNDYPIMVKYFVENGEIMSGLIICFDKGKYSNLCTHQAVCLSGVTFHCYMAERTKRIFEDEKKELFIQDDKMYAIKEDLKGFFQKDKILRRFWDNDVTSAMKRLKIR